MVLSKPWVKTQYIHRPDSTVSMAAAAMNPPVRRRLNSSITGAPRGPVARIAGVTYKVRNTAEPTHNAANRMCSTRTPAYHSPIMACPFARKVGSIHGACGCDNLLGPTRAGTANIRRVLDAAHSRGTEARSMSACVHDRGR